MPMIQYEPGKEPEPQPYFMTIELLIPKKINKEFMIDIEKLGDNIKELKIIADTDLNIFYQIEGNKSIQTEIMAWVAAIESLKLFEYVSKVL